MADIVSLNIAQILFNSLLTGSLYVLAAIGLTLTYGILKFPNVAHAEFITFGAYFAYTVADIWKLGFPAGAAAALVATGVLGVASQLFVFGPLIRKGASILHLTVASIGYGIVLRYAMQEVWGRKDLYFSAYYPGFDLGPIRVTPLWLSFIFLAVAVVAVFHFLLTRTKIGRAMRATSNNPALAQASGIDTKKVILLVWFLGSALAGLGGVMKASDTRITPVLGWDVLIMSFAAVIFGGVGSIYGTILAGYILGFVENLGVIGLVALGLSTEYRFLLGFLVLVCALIFAPQGIAGITFRSMRKRLRTVG
ncbi:MAG: branched-chain amino acid ABC transporter permease [Nitrososphaerales archaeon]